MHWNNGNPYSIWYMTLMSTMTEIGRGDKEIIGHLFSAMYSDLDSNRLIFSYHGFAPRPFGDNGRIWK